MLLVREYPIDDECVRGNDGGRNYDDKEKEEWDRNSLMYGIRILEGVVEEREVLVVRFDGVQSPEGNKE